MSWIEICISVAREAVARAETGLEQLGALAVTLEAAGFTIPEGSARGGAFEVIAAEDLSCIATCQVGIDDRQDAVASRSAHQATAGAGRPARNCLDTDRRRGG